MYLQKYEQESYLSAETPGTDIKPQVTYEYFLRHYKETFNYPFGRPRTDICALCEKLKVEIRCEKIAAVRETLKRELQLHKSKAKLFYEDMRECQALVQEGGAEYGTSECVVFDYMQNIPNPYMPVTEMFYARQLWLYVLGFHRISDNRAFMYSYTELTGGKTPNETVSFLHDQSLIKDYKAFFSSVKKPVPLSKNQDKWKITTYKSIEYRNICLRVSKSSSGLVTETFHFRQKRFSDCRLLTRAYEDEIAIKPAKAKDIGKYVSAIDPQHRQQFEELMQKYGNQKHTNAESESDAWDSD